MNDDDAAERREIVRLVVAIVAVIALNVVVWLVVMPAYVRWAAH